MRVLRTPAAPPPVQSAPHDARANGCGRAQPDAGGFRGAVDDAPPLGFTAASAPRQREVEAALLALPSAARCEAHHRELTRAPHVAGTEGSRRVAELVARVSASTGWRPRS